MKLLSLAVLFVAIIGCQTGGKGDTPSASPQPTEASHEGHLHHGHSHPHHAQHNHKHQKNCGHLAAQHDDHVDYTHGDHKHHEMDGHTHDCEGAKK